MFLISGKHILNLFFTHTLAIITDTDTDSPWIPGHRKMNLAFPVNISDSMVHCILHYRLKDHTRHTDILHRFIHVTAKMNIPCKPHIQNINIVVYCLQLLSQSSILLSLLYIIPEKVCHLFHKDSGFLRILHHGQLRACIQGIKKKMRIDLRLKIF